jgi:mannose-6-phosphate isomerase
MIAYSPDQPIVLNHNRVKRAYTGGKLLDQWQGIEPAVDSNMSEEWLISTVEVTNIDRSTGEGLSMTTTEDGQTVSLMSIISSNPEGFLGDKHYAKYGNQIGVLARVGDTNVRLVVQAHPDKTTPHVYAGFKSGVTREIWEKLFKKQDVQGMLDAMHKIPIKRGDVIFIKAAMPHTIGPGVLFLELHEPSDYILRLEKKYLNIRTFPDDDLHCGMGYERLFDCFDYTTYTEKEILDQIMISPKTINEGGSYAEFKLLSHELTDCFAINKVLVEKKYTLVNASRHCIVVVVNGSRWISGGRNKKEIRAGQGIFVPAGLKRMTFEANSQGLEIVIGYPPVISD